MKIPNCENAEVPKRKVVDYLLCLGHPEGGPKARFFLGWGFTVEEWRELASALIKQANENDYAETVWGKHGTKYIVIAPIDAPKGTTPEVKSVWMIPEGKEHPRLISGYPAS